MLQPNFIQQLLHITPRCVNNECHWLDQCQHGRWQYTELTRLPPLSHRVPHQTHCFDFECGHYATHHVDSEHAIICHDCNEKI